MLSKEKIQEEKERVRHGNSKPGVSEERWMHPVEYKRERNPNEGEDMRNRKTHRKQ